MTLTAADDPTIVTSSDGVGRLSQVEDVELLIRGGTVIDGSGGPRRAGTVAVSAGRLRMLAEDPGSLRAARTVDATGLVVAPGFIDLHSHSGLMVLADPRHEPKLRQGVTTEVIGVDGNAYAPFASRADLLAFVRLNAGLDGIPELAYDWGSVASYLSRFDRRVSVNLCLLVGNSALRIDALGWDDVPADRSALDRMRGLLRESMEEGAFGVSSGLDYAPGAFATTDELAELTEEAARLGGIYHTHVRYALGDRFLDPFREAVEIGRRGQGPVHLTHFYHRATYPGPPEQMLGLVDDARASGQDVTFDSYPYEWASTRMLIMLPPWTQAGGPEPTMARLADRAVRDRLRQEIGVRGRSYAGADPWDDLRMGYFGRPENAPWEGRTLGDYMRQTGLDAVDAICDLLLAEDLRVNQVTPGPWTGGLAPFLKHPVAMIGTDSTFVGRKPSPRTYGSFPRILGQFVRDMRLMPLEEAVRKMTAAPAARLGLRQRGLLRDGMVADVVLFDPSTVRATATYEEPRQFPEGIPYVLVNGEFVVDGGVHTGATPGVALRRGQA
ncbi:MAG: D-aminoacylase [Chloroflexi bacterium]|nr:D-aminoacylase [Chloroflexota bacterium]